MKVLKTHWRLPFLCFKNWLALMLHWSVFSLIQTHASDNTALNLSTGLGCVIISKPNSHGNSYANLVWKESQGSNGFGNDYLDFALAGADHSSRPSLDTGKSWARTNTQYQEKDVMWSHSQKLNFKSRFWTSIFNTPNSRIFNRLLWSD